jgi:aspartate--ammonia ligase
MQIFKINYLEGQMSQLILPENYDSPIDLMESQRAIKKIKDYFQDELAYGLKLRRVSAPLFVDPATGLNDNLNGVERRVNFSLKGIDELEVEVVQSLAKWKRMALGKYGIEAGNGIYTDMNAIRRDEDLDNLHSVYVDQWDWEKVIKKEQRTEEYLKETVNTIYNSVKNLGDFVNRLYRNIRTELPNEIFFVTTQELEDMYPDLTPKEREDAITKKHGAVFIMKIGGKLASGEKHDGRSPDYDDWELNGDIILWNEILDRAFEISSMGIRVDADAMRRQLEAEGCQDRAELEFQKAVLEDRLPYTIGGGIGQSRLCMFFLRKAHIGEVQASVWPNEMIETCKEHNIYLL